MGVGVPLTPLPALEILFLLLAFTLSCCVLFCLGGLGGLLFYTERQREQRGSEPGERIGGRKVGRNGGRGNWI